MLTRLICIVCDFHFLFSFSYCSFYLDCLTVERSPAFNSPFKIIVAINIKMTFRAQKKQLQLKKKKKKP